MLRQPSGVEQFSQPPLLDRLFRILGAAVQPILDSVRQSWVTLGLFISIARCAAEPQRGVVFAEGLERQHSGLVECFSPSSSEYRTPSESRRDGRSDSRYFFERNGIHAVSEATRGWAIWKHMTEVCVAGGAQRFDAFQKRRSIKTIRNHIA